MHVWATNLNSNNPADHFVHASRHHPVGGAYSLTVQPGYLYTITTTTGAGQGHRDQPRRRARWPCPTRDNFDGYTAGHEAKYLQDKQGAFEAAACGGGRSGMCLRQACPAGADHLEDPQRPVRTYWAT